MTDAAGKVKITTSVSHHCQEPSGSPDQCLKIAGEVFPGIPWIFIETQEDCCLFEALVDGETAKRFLRATGQEHSIAQ